MLNAIILSGPDVLNAIVIFALLFVLDFVWALYTRAIQADHAGMASGTAAFIFLLNGLATVSYVAEPWLLGFAMAGAFAGTYAAMK